MGLNSTTVEISYTSLFTFPWVKLNSPKKKLPHLQYVENVLPGVFSWRRWSNCKRWLEKIRRWCTRITRRPTDYKTSCHLLLVLSMIIWNVIGWHLVGEDFHETPTIFLICCFKRNLAMNITIHVYLVLLKQDVFSFSFWSPGTKLIHSFFLPISILKIQKKFIRFRVKYIYLPAFFVHPLPQMRLKNLRCHVSN